MVSMKAFLLFVLVTFNPTKTITLKVDSNNKEKEESFTPLSQYTLDLFKEINDQHLSFEVLEIALKGYSELSLKNKLRNKKFLTIS